MRPLIRKLAWLALALLFATNSFAAYWTSSWPGSIVVNTLISPISYAGADYAYTASPPDALVVWVKPPSGSWTVAYATMGSGSNSTGAFAYTPNKVGTWNFELTQEPNALGGAPTGLVLLTASVNVTALSQPTVTVSPTSASVAPGGSVTFTAGGGAGTGGWVWGGSASGSGSTNSTTFPSPGTYTVTVYRSSDSTYFQSNTASSTITVTKLTQPTVSVSPSNTGVPTGGSVTFTASGGGGSGGWVWGGSASGSGSTSSVTFNSPGTYTVTVYRSTDASYLVSNTASATIGVASATGFTVPGGADLNTIFNAKVGGSSASATSFQVNGTDLNAMFEPVSSSTKRAAATGFTVNGTDLNQIFSPIGKVGQ